MAAVVGELVTVEAQKMAPLAEPALDEPRPEAVSQLCEPSAVMAVLSVPSTVPPVLKKSLRPPLAVDRLAHTLLSLPELPPGQLEQTTSQPHFGLHEPSAASQYDS